MGKMVILLCGWAGPLFSGCRDIVTSHAVRYSVLTCCTKENV